MNTTFKRILAGLAASVAVSTAAFAADVSPVVIPAPAPIVVVPAAVPAFDFAGAYVGTKAALMLCDGVCWLNVQGQAGYNIVAGRFLAGIELAAGAYLLDGTGAALSATARAGVVLGRVLAYGKAGITMYGPAPFSSYLVLGGGVELGIGQSLSVFAGFTAERSFGGGTFYPGIEAGVNFHFGH